MSSRSRLSLSSTANCLNIVAVIGLGRFSASFSNVLYASTVYWYMRPSCCSPRTLVVSTAVIPSLYLRHLHDHVTDQFRLTRQPIGLFQFLVGLVRSRGRQQIPGAEDLDPASSARAVAAAHMADDHSHVQRARQERFTCRKFSRFPLILERDSRHEQLILLFGVRRLAAALGPRQAAAMKAVPRHRTPQVRVTHDGPCRNFAPAAQTPRAESRVVMPFGPIRRTGPACSSAAPDDGARSAPDTVPW